MYRIGTTAAVAADLIESIDRHMPVGVEMGTPLVIVRGHLVIEVDGQVGVLSVTPRGLSRYAARPDGSAELVCWSHGVEQYRHAVTAGRADQGA